jgi:hypothetical protein
LGNAKGIAFLSGHFALDLSRRLLYEDHAIFVKKVTPKYHPGRPSIAPAEKILPRLPRECILHYFLVAWPKEGPIV